MSKKLNTQSGFWLLLLLPLFALGQAGSSEPVRFTASMSLISSGAVTAETEPMVPHGVLKLAEDEVFLLWVELEAGKLHLLERNNSGGLDTRQIIPVSIGKNGYGKNEEGDGKTPVGVYRLTSFLTDEQLIDYYGLGAYPLNYPNVTDRQQARTGSGIWLHGLPKGVDSRPLWDSDGCVVIDNDTFLELQQYITTGITHIVLSEESISWKSAHKSEARSEALEKAFSAWQSAWENRDNKNYLAFYADDFNSFNRNKIQWDEYKSRVNNSKNWIQIGTSQVSFFTDLQKQELVTVRYYQDYQSNNYNWKGWKEQLWRESDSGWQIIYEGNG